jgi:hypothetical protein
LWGLHLRLPARRGAQGGMARQELTEHKSHSIITLLNIKRAVFKGFYQCILNENAESVLFEFFITWFWAVTNR